MAPACPTTTHATRAFQRIVAETSALGPAGNRLPLSPAGEPLLVDLTRPAQRVGAEKHPQRRVFGIDNLKKGTSRGFRVAGCQPALPLTSGLSDEVVLGHLLRPAGRRPGPGGAVEAGLHQGDP